MFDGYSAFGVKMLRRQPAVRAANAGPTMHWSIDDRTNWKPRSLA